MQYALQFPDDVVPIKHGHVEKVCNYAGQRCGKPFFVEETKNECPECGYLSLSRPIVQKVCRCCEVRFWVCDSVTDCLNCSIENSLTKRVDDYPVQTASIGVAMKYQIELFPHSVELGIKNRSSREKEKTTWYKNWLDKKKKRNSGIFF